MSIPMMGSVTLWHQGRMTDLLVASWDPRHAEIWSMASFSCRKTLPAVLPDTSTANVSGSWRSGTTLSASGLPIFSALLCLGLAVLPPGRCCCDSGTQKERLTAKDSLGLLDAGVLIGDSSGERVLGPTP